MKAQDILDSLSRSDIVQKIDVIALVEEPGKQALRARAFLENGLILNVTEAFGKGFRIVGRRGRESLPFQRRDESCPAQITFTLWHNYILFQIYSILLGLLPAVEKTQAARTKP